MAPFPAISPGLCFPGPASSAYRKGSRATCYSPTCRGSGYPLRPSSRLEEIIASEGVLSAEESAAYLQQLKSEPDGLVLGAVNCGARSGLYYRNTWRAYEKLFIGGAKLAPPDSFFFTELKIMLWVDKKTRTNGASFFYSENTQV
jgi:hypothetical protein